VYAHTSRSVFEASFIAATGVVGVWWLGSRGDAAAKKSRASNSLATAEKKALLYSKIDNDEIAARFVFNRASAGNPCDLGAGVAVVGPKAGFLHR